MKIFSTLLLTLAIMGTAGTSYGQKKIKIKKNQQEVVVKTDSVAVKRPSKKTSIADKTKGNSKSEGLFTIYQDTATGSVQFSVKKDQLGKEFIYQSFSMGGPTNMFLNQNMIRNTWVIRIDKKYDKLEFSQVNTNFYYDPKNPVSKAANVDVPATVFYSAKIDAEDSLAYLVAGDGLFISEKLDPIRPVIAPGPMAMQMFNIGSLNPSKSGYKSVRSYPDNTDVIVELAYDNPAPFNGGGKDITDARYSRITFQHSFLEMPVNDFRPRRDDPRVGYFTQEVDDLTTLAKEKDFKDVINRWNLVKKDPKAALSEPVEPIVWWIENTTPLEFRETIKEAGLKWNEAFEKAGFKNAVVMKIMPDTASWDPGDIRYNVIRWVSSPYPSYGAIGPSFVNPRTGQILGSDITVEWFSGSFTPVYDDLFTAAPAQDLATQILQPAPVATPTKLGKNIITCALSSELKAQYSAGLTVLEAGGASPEEIKTMHKEFLYYLIMHEMGHTLGLNHNMKASSMLSPAQVHDKALTQRIGLIGSVMDYPAINVALDRKKQGEYYTTKAGPYDLWAIEFGYTPFEPAQETAGLNKILSRSTDPQLTFGNDADDMRSPGNGIDPRVMVNDMSSDMVAYATERLLLVNKTMGNLRSKYAKNGESYATLKQRYGMLFTQRNQMLQAVSRYIGGVYVDRSFIGQETSNKPFTPVPASYQKKALKLIADYAFAPNAFEADVKLFPYLQSQRRGFGFFGNPEDIKPTTNVLRLQTSVLSFLLNPVTLSRINNSSLYGNTYSITDMMTDLSNSIFAADIKTDVNLYRINLQTEYVKALAAIVSAERTPFDNVSIAAIGYSLRRIKTQLSTAVSPTSLTRAHRENLILIIDKALSENNPLK